jgi:hypothetical protein
MAVQKITYGTSTAITCTLASLASSSSAGRSCAAIDNGTDLFDDALLTIGVRTSASALANDKACYVWIFGSEDGTNYGASSSEAVGTNVAVTLSAPSNMRGPFVISCPAISTTYRVVIPVASFFGGDMPRKWGFVLQNFTGQALDSTEGNHQKTYTGITYTIV